MGRISDACLNTFGKGAEHRVRNWALLIGGIVAAAGVAFALYQFHGQIGHGFSKFGNMIAHKWQTSQAMRIGVYTTAAVVATTALGLGAAKSYHYHKAQNTRAKGLGMENPAYGSEDEDETSRFFCSPLSEEYTLRFNDGRVRGFINPNFEDIQGKSAMAFQSLET
ncbi:MAG: hypothetical protein H7A36_00615 [Chlamydiales bacterium]|nr:hypothetical protein [Chlamydiales bacterium]